MNTLEIFLTILILVLIIIFGIFVWRKWENNNKKYSMITSLVFLFVGIFCVQFLSLRFESKILGLGKELDTLNTQQLKLLSEQKEIRDIVSNVVKMNWLVLSSDVTNKKDERVKLMLKYTRRLYPYMDSASISELKMDIEVLSK